MVRVVHCNKKAVFVIENFKGSTITELCRLLRFLTSTCFPGKTNISIDSTMKLPGVVGRG